MARKARLLDPNGIYLVHQTASQTRPLFGNEYDRIKFLKILKQTKIRFNFKLFAFCIKGDNDYYLVIGANGSDLSKVMKSINIAYAMYIRSKEKLFKDRYKSITLEHSVNVMEAVDRFNLEQSSYEGTEDFDGFKKEIKLIDSFLEFAKEQKTSSCDDCIQSVEEAQQKLLSIAKLNDLSVDYLLKDKARRDDLILKFRKSSTLSLKELGELFGGLSESTVCKILKDQCR